MGTDKVKYDKGIKFNDGSQALVTTALDNLNIEFRCDVSGTSQSAEGGGLAKGRKVEGVKVRLNFASTTLLEAMRFASGGQSFRVAIQAKLRLRPVVDLESKTHEFAMSDVFNPPKRGFTPMTPERHVAKLLEAGMTQADIIKMIEAAKNAE